MDKAFVGAQQMLAEQGFNIVNSDETRPWGGFFVIDETQAQKFAESFFSDVEIETNGKLSPKILIVAPNKRLSWQYHNRRAEIWTVYNGKAGAIVSDSDEQGELQILEEGDVISLKAKERHRLIGLDEHCIVAEIWQHTDPENPSDESDIVRVQDDYGR